VVLDYVVTGIEGIAELSPTILRNHREKLIKLTESIRSREFSPKPSQYHQCAAIRYYGDVEDEEEASLEG
jgi:hypothetical protein